MTEYVNEIKKLTYCERNYRTDYLVQTEKLGEFFVLPEEYDNPYARLGLAQAVNTFLMWVIAVRYIPDFAEESNRLEKLLEKDYNGQMDALDVATDVLHFEILDVIREQYGKDTTKICESLECQAIRAAYAILVSYTPCCLQKEDKPSRSRWDAEVWSDADWEIFCKWDETGDFPDTLSRLASALGWNIKPKHWNTQYCPAEWDEEEIIRLDVNWYTMSHEWPYLKIFMQIVYGWSDAQQPILDAEYFSYEVPICKGLFKCWKSQYNDELTKAAYEMHKNGAKEIYRSNELADKFLPEPYYLVKFGLWDELKKEKEAADESFLDKMFELAQHYIDSNDDVDVRILRDFLTNILPINDSNRIKTLQRKPKPHVPTTIINQDIHDNTTVNT